MTVVEKVQNLISNDGITQSELARKIGKSPAVISMYLKGEYSGDTEKLEEDLKKFLELNKGVKKYKKVALEFVKTSVAAKIFNIAQIAQYNGEMALCTGSAGLGKTTAIRQYAKEHSGVILIDPDEKISVRNLLIYIGRSLKIKMGQTESNTEFCERIVKKLKDSGRIIIIDEAENLDISCFRALRKIHDRCEFTCGLLFVGTEVLASKLSSLRGEYDYIFTRFGYIDSLDLLTDSDTKNLVTQIFPDCSDSLLQQFSKYSRNNARILFNLLKRTSDLVASSKDELNTRMIKSAGFYVGAAHV